MKYLQVLILVGFLLFLSYCGDKGPTGNSQGDDDSLIFYQPLKVGNWWKYERVSWEIGEPTVVDTYSITVIEEDTVLEGKTAFCIEEDNGDLMWLVVVNNELRMYENIPNETLPYYIFLKLPIEVGNSWKHYSEPFQDQFLWAEIISINETIVVPAGTFNNCIHVNVEPYFNAWYKKGIGGIRFSNCSIDSTYGVDDKIIEYYIQ